MTIIIAIFLFLIFLFISIIHFYWAFGGSWGSDSVLPTKENKEKVLNPSALPTVIVALGVLVFGLIVLIKSELFEFSLPSWVNQYGLWIIAGIFILRAIGDFNYVGFFKKIKETKFGKNDTKYFSPLCLLIGILTLILEINN